MGAVGRGCGQAVPGAPSRANPGQGSGTAREGLGHRREGSGPGQGAGPARPQPPSLGTARPPGCPSAPGPRSHLLALLALLLHGSGGGPGPPRGIPARVSGGASARGGGGHGPPGSRSSPASRSRSRSRSGSRRRLSARGSAPPPSWAAPSRDVIVPPPWGQGRSAPAPNPRHRGPRPSGKATPPAVSSAGHAHHREPRPHSPAP